MYINEYRPNEYRPYQLDDNLIENNNEDCSYPKKIKLMRETIRCRKTRGMLAYHVPNKHLSPEKIAHHVLLLFYTLRDEKKLLSDFPRLNQNRLQEEGVGCCNYQQNKV